MFDKKQMFSATCDKCGNKCEVPFKPSGGKPVLCSDCFSNQGNKHQGRSGGDRNRSSFDRGDRSGDRNMHKATCDNCGNSCEVPFKPTAGKPIYCNDCFSKKNESRDRRGGDGGRDRNRGGGGNDQVAQQLNALNGKMDRVISLLESASPKKGYPKKESVTKATPKKTVKKKQVKKTAKKKK